MFQSCHWGIKEDHLGWIASFCTLMQCNDDCYSFPREKYGRAKLTCLSHLELFAPQLPFCSLLVPHYGLKSCWVDLWWGFVWMILPFDKGAWLNDPCISCYSGTHFSVVCMTEIVQPYTGRMKMAISRWIIKGKDKRDKQRSMASESVNQMPKCSFIALCYNSVSERKARLDLFLAVSFIGVGNLFLMKAHSNLLAPICALRWFR